MCTCSHVHPLMCIACVQVHPDRHPTRIAEATKATARVNQAMDLRSRMQDPNGLMA